MNATNADDGLPIADTAPGDTDQPEGLTPRVLRYLAGYGIAVALTALSFFIARSTLVWAPSIPIALSVLAVAQMGVHLFFFLHVTSGQDSINNLMALGFGLLIVMLLVFGSLWIIDHLDRNMMPMPIERVMQMQR